MKRLAALTAVLVAVFFAIGAATAAPPEKFVIKEIQKAKPPVAFNHKAHGEKVPNCQACHHKDAAGKEQKCSKCHGKKTEDKKVELKEAFHKQCKDCHKKEAKGPQKCDECHKK